MKVAGGKCSGAARTHRSTRPYAPRPGGAHDPVTILAAFMRAAFHGFAASVVPALFSVPLAVAMPNRMTVPPAI